MEWILLIGIIWFIAFITENRPGTRKTRGNEKKPAGQYREKNLSELKEERLKLEAEIGAEEELTDKLEETKGTTKTTESDEELDEIFGNAELIAREKIAKQKAESEKECSKTLRLANNPPENRQIEPKQDRLTKISEMAQKRGVQQLVHFTRVENLSSIFSHGLQGVNYLRANKLLHDYNDEYRFDGRLNGISLSITHPNSLMLYKYRKQGKPGAWAILLLDIQVLEKQCLFFKGNAASNNERFKSTDELTGPERFEEMFEGSSYSHVPKDIQAEVMCMEPIPPSLIKAVVFQNSYEERTAKALQLPVPTYVDRNLFERSPFQGVQ